MPAGEWHHDLSLYAALLLVCVVAISPAARRAAVGRRAEEPPRAGRVEPLHEALIAAARAAAVVFLGFLLSFPAVILAAGGRGELPVLVALALALAALVIRGAAWPLAGAALVIVGFVSWSLLRFEPVDQSSRALVVRPANPVDLFPDWDPTDLEGTNQSPKDHAHLEAGRAPVLVDLRALEISGVLNIEARSSLDRVIVALPRDRCWNVNVEFARLHRRLPSAYIETAPLFGVYLAQDNASRFPIGATGWSDTQAVLGEPKGSPDSSRRDEPAFAHSLIAFGEGVDGRRGRWTRTVDEARSRDAATLNLWASAGTQVVVRDYPDDLPLDVVQRASSQWQDRDEERELLEWPEPSDVPIPLRGGSAERLPPVPTTPIDAKLQAARLAGACATREEKARRWVRVEPETQAIPVAGDLATYVNGLGERRRVRLSS